MRKIKKEIREREIYIERDTKGGKEGKMEKKRGRELEKERVSKKRKINGREKK